MDRITSRAGVPHPLPKFRRLPVFSKSDANPSRDVVTSKKRCSRFYPRRVGLSPVLYLYFKGRLLGDPLQSDRLRARNIRTWPSSLRSFAFRLFEFPLPTTTGEIPRAHSNDSNSESHPKPTWTDPNLKEPRARSSLLMHTQEARRSGP